MIIEKKVELLVIEVPKGMKYAFLECRNALASRAWKIRKSHPKQAGFLKVMSHSIHERQALLTGEVELLPEKKP
ncbi:MAG: hypothetical protein ABFE07_28335 [Armatimonadia bacterium]